MGGPRWRQDLWRVLRSFSSAVFRGYGSIFWLLLLAITILMILPLLSPWTLAFPSLVPKEAAAAFLSTLWQVEAAALGLSVAVIVVAFEVFSVGDAWPLRRSLQESGLISVLYVGIVSLVVAGLVILGVGDGAPGGWAATWATVLAGVEFVVLLPFLFTRATKALDRREIQKVRAKRARDDVFRAVDQEVLDRIALSILRRLSGVPEIDLELALPSPVQPGGISIPAPKAGDVGDINVWRLGRLAKLVKEDAPSSGGLKLRVTIGQRIGINSLLLVLPPGLPKRARRIARKVVVV